MFGFGEQEPVPARSEALALARALVAVVEAGQALKAAKAAVPSYTGQWDDKDYYAQQQEDFNRAADAYAGAVRAVNAAPNTPPEAPHQYQNFLSQPIRELPLSIRVTNGLYNESYVFLGDYFTRGDGVRGLRRAPNIGKKTIAEFSHYLRSNGLDPDGDADMVRGWIRPSIEHR